MGKIKDHIKKHKELYIGIGVGTVVATAAAVLYFGTRSGNPSITAGDKSTNLINSTLVNFVERSTPSKPIHLVGTNLYFDSIHEAARHTGLDRSSISKNVNGLVDDVKGSVFELLEKAA